MSEAQEDIEGELVSAPVAAAPKHFPCGQCGAKLEFMPGAESLVCQYCGHSNLIPKSEADIVELDYTTFLDAAAETSEQVESLIIKCGQCAAETTLQPNVTSVLCPYCGTTVVAQGVCTRAIKPQSLLPFKITQPQAWAVFRKWINSLWFAPNDLKLYACTESKLVGLYVPYWTYDSDATSFYRGERGDDYWVTVGSGKNRTRVRRTRWVSVRGTVWNTFNDILIMATHSLPHKYAAKLEPWDLQNLVPYQDDYLSGFRAERYSVDLGAGFSAAQGIMHEKIRENVRHDMGGDHQRIHAVKTRYEDVTFKHLLLPVWMTAYRYRQKIYRILINARTGEVQGERPWSWVKIALTALAGLATIGVLVALAQQ